MEFYGLLIFVVGVISILIRKQSILKNSLIILLIFYFLFIHVIINTAQCSRYRVPLHPFFMIFAANGLYLIFKIAVRDFFVKKVKKR
jgi:hypothetical protein